MPVKKNDDILLDSMIISHMLIAGGEEFDENSLNPSRYNPKECREIVQKIKKRLDDCDSKLILLDVVEEEVIHMKERDYNKIYTNEDIETALAHIGNFKKIKVDYSNKDIIDAKRLLLAEEHCNWFTGEPLSKIDCILLKIHVTQALLKGQPASLLTEDETLQEATMLEGRGTKEIDGIGANDSEQKERKKLESTRIAQRQAEIDLEKQRETREAALQRIAREEEEKNRLEEERIELKRLEENKLRITYHFCSECGISYTESKECPNCGK